jgi:hypothetical protein
MAFRPLAARPDSNVIAAEYDDEATTLRLTFRRDKRQYEYYQVPGKVAAGFSSSGLTAGRYFRVAVMGQYEYAEVG